MAEWQAVYKSELDKKDVKDLEPTKPASPGAPTVIEPTKEELAAITELFRAGKTLSEIKALTKRPVTGFKFSLEQLAEALRVFNEVYSDKKAKEPK
jgi:hypothetical protein